MTRSKIQVVLGPPLCFICYLLILSQQITWHRANLSETIIRKLFSKDLKHVLSLREKILMTR